MNRKKRESNIAYMLGNSVKVVEYIKRNVGNSKLLLRCSKCGRESQEWESQIISGEWEVCEHDLD